jgi:prepilin-type N-terminal cleavage/methylation domain-containing protein
MNCQPTSRRHAFTLIEIMVAMMIFSMVIAAIYATWALVTRATQVGQNAAAQAQRQRVVLRTIGDALMGIESFQASQNLYWFKLANGDKPYLSFVARLPDTTFQRSGKFTGTTPGMNFNSRRVTFKLVTGDNGEKDLILQQTPILMNMDLDEQQYPLVLARNVKVFTIEWWGTNKLNHVDWSMKWDDTQTNTIPQMLRVNLVLGGNGTPDFAAARIFTVPSSMMPATVQNGIPGVPGFPGGPRSQGGPRGQGGQGNGNPMPPIQIPPFKSR